jgi:uncharacterized protein (TIGR00730 family)
VSLLSLLDRKKMSVYRIACFGSSSNLTPQKYLDAAYELGNLLAKGSHLCVNGGGKDGCMGALNRGALAGEGKIRGVIHEMWIGEEEQPGIEMVVARGDDLAERKKLLFDNADAIISLPGGLGTFDELYEAVAARQLGLNGLKPVCLVNTDGFFDATLAQLDRMFEDKLLRGPWQNVLGNAPTAAAALEYIVTELAQQAKTSTEE